jgi:hypothetical protein
MALPLALPSVTLAAAATASAHEAAPTKTSTSSQGCCCRWHWSQLISGPATLASAAASAFAFYINFPIIGGLAAAGAVGGAIGFVVTSCLAPRKALEGQIDDLGTIDTSIKQELQSLRELKARVEAATRIALESSDHAGASAAMTTEDLRAQYVLLAAQLSKTTQRVEELGSLLTSYQQLVEGMDTSVQQLSSEGRGVSATATALGEIVIDMRVHVGATADAAVVIERESDEYRVEQEKFAAHMQNYRGRIKELAALLHDIVVSKEALAARVGELEGIEGQLLATQARVSTLTERLGVLTRTLETRIVNMDEAHEAALIRDFTSAHLGSPTAAAPSLLPASQTASLATAVDPLAAGKGAGKPQAVIGDGAI